MLFDKPHLKTVNITYRGEVPISPEILKYLGLSVGDPLLEISFGGYLLYVPVGKILSTLSDKTEAIFNKLGINVQTLKASVEVQKPIKEAPINNNDDIGIPIIVPLHNGYGQEYY